MKETPLQIDNNTKDVKLHSSKAIGGATFLGGPLAAGYLVRENFNALKKPIEARNALIIGILATVVLFGVIFMIPENILDKIPNQIIPLIYTGIIWGMVEWQQGKDLEKHKENGNAFFSGWRAAGVGIVSLVILAIGLFTYGYTQLDNPVYDIYDEKMTEFSKNEVESMQFFEKTETNDNKFLLTIVR